MTLGYVLRPFLGPENGWPSMNNYGYLFLALLVLVLLSIVANVAAIRKGSKEKDLTNSQDSMSRNEGLASKTDRTGSAVPDRVPNISSEEKEQQESQWPLSLPVEEFSRKANSERLASDLLARLVTVDKDNDQRAIAKVLLDGSEDEAIRHEAAQILLRSHYSLLTRDLFNILNSDAESAQFKSYAIQYLWQRLEYVQSEEKIQIVDRLASELRRGAFPVKREALLALCRIGDPRGSNAAIKILEDHFKDDAEMWDVAIRCIQDCNMKDQVKLIRPYADSDREPTRIAAIVALAEWRDADSRPAFEAAAKSSEMRIQLAGRAALNKLKTLEEARQEPYYVPGK